MMFQHTNYKKLMVIHNLQTLFHLLVDIVHKRDLKIYFYLQASALFNTKIFTHWSALCSVPFVFRYVDTLYYKLLQKLLAEIHEEADVLLQQCT